MKKKYEKQESFSDIESNFHDFFCFISYLVFGTYGSTVIISAKHAISHLAEIEPLFNRERGEARQTRRR